MNDDDRPAFYTPREAAARLGVDSHTLSRWARTGRIRSVMTLGGHRRYKAADIEAIREGTHGT